LSEYAEQWESGAMTKRERREALVELSEARRLTATDRTVSLDSCCDQYKRSLPLRCLRSPPPCRLLRSRHERCRGCRVARMASPSGSHLGEWGFRRPSAFASSTGRSTWCGSVNLVPRVTSPSGRSHNSLDSGRLVRSGWRRSLVCTAVSADRQRPCYGYARGARGVAAGRL
jgi:hypothetical protein